MKANLIAPPWMRAAITALALLGSANCLFSPIAWFWQVTGILYSYVAWRHTQSNLITHEWQLTPIGTHWRIFTPQHGHRTMGIADDALLFKHFTWCTFYDDTPTPSKMHAFITPSMLSNDDYCKIRRDINLRKTLGVAASLP